eukprot:9473912-Pyramimonas_sp.AAC.1
MGEFVGRRGEFAGAVRMYRSASPATAASRIITVTESTITFGLWGVECTLAVIGTGGPVRGRIPGDGGLAHDYGDGNHDHLRDPADAVPEAAGHLGPAVRPLQPLLPAALHPTAPPRGGRRPPGRHQLRAALHPTAPPRGGRRPPLTFMQNIIGKKIKNENCDTQHFRVLNTLRVVRTLSATCSGGPVNAKRRCSVVVLLARRRDCVTWWWPLTARERACTNYIVLYDHIQPRRFSRAPRLAGVCSDLANPPVPPIHPRYHRSPPVPPIHHRYHRFTTDTTDSPPVPPIHRRYHRLTADTADSRPVPPTHPRYHRFTTGTTDSPPIPPIHARYHRFTPGTTDSPSVPPIHPRARET